MANTTHFVSGGRNPNRELTCALPQCRWLDKGTYRDGGWRTHPANRQPLTNDGNQTFTPSVSSTEGYDPHSESMGA